MGFVHAEYDDLFVSYAHVDDKPEEGFESGWVSTLVRSLKNELARKLGRPDAASVWMDHQLATNCRVTPEIEDRIRRCALLLLVLSEGYLASVWCLRELQEFLAREIGRRRGTTSNIFVVEYARIQRPPELSDLLGKRFWEVDPDDDKRTRTIGFPEVDPADRRRYYNLLNDLCRDMVAELQRQKALTDPGGPPPPPPPDRSIYLAEASDDLEDQYDEVKRYLTQHSYGVVPTRVYPSEPEAFEEAVRGDLGPARLFVQLLSELPGKKLDKSERRRVAVQHECAVTLKKPILQWRRGGINMDKVSSPIHRALLNGPEVMEVDLEEFKAAIVQRDRILSAPPSTPPRPDNCFIFVNMTEEDHELAVSVEKELKQYGVWTALPVQTGEVAKDAKDFEDNVKDCDGLVLVHGKMKLQWVRAQLRQLRRLDADRKDPLSAIGVYDGPPPKQPGIEMEAPNLRIIHGQNGPPRQEIMDFVNQVRQAYNRSS
jgi:hypothetical protein